MQVGYASLLKVEVCSAEEDASTDLDRAFGKRHSTDSPYSVSLRMMEWMSSFVYAAF